MSKYFFILIFSLLLLRFEEKEVSALESKKYSFLNYIKNFALVSVGSGNKGTTELTCEKSNDDLIKFYETTGNDFNFNSKPSKYIDELLDKAMNGQEVTGSDIWKYFVKNFLFGIIMLVIDILLVIFWIPFCICTFGKCCC